MRVCRISGCDGRHWARGLCVKHYNRWRRHGDVEAGALFFGPGPCPGGCGRETKDQMRCPDCLAAAILRATAFAEVWGRLFQGAWAISGNQSIPEVAPSLLRGSRKQIA